MRVLRFTLCSILAVTFFASISQAQVQRTFVSGLGNDANPCSRTAPCRTFGAALAQTNASGEVIVLDSAGYGQVTITQAVSIIASPGAYAGISVFGGDGIDINAGASDAVTLRGLTINSQGGSHGVVFNSGGSLHVENCAISGFSSGFGVFFNGPGRIEVKDSIMRNDLRPIHIVTASGTALGIIDHVQIDGGGFIGVQVRDNCKATIRNSSISDVNIGMACNSFGNPAELNVESCVISNNVTGIQSAIFVAGGSATVRISNTTVTDNSGNGLQATSTAVILSRGNNTVEGNGTDIIGNIGPYSAK